MFFLECIYNMYACIVSCTTWSEAASAQRHSLNRKAWIPSPSVKKKTPTYLLDPTCIVNMPFQSLSTAPSFPLATVESQLPMQRRPQRHLWALAAPMLSTNHNATGKLPGLPDVAEAKWLATWEGRYEEIIYTSFNRNSWTESNQNRRSLWPKRYLAHCASHFGRCCSAVPGDECKLQTPLAQTASPTFYAMIYVIKGYMNPKQRKLTNCKRFNY